MSLSDRAPVFVPHEQCKVASGECFRLGYCISGCIETPLTKWDRLERENAELRRALGPFARVASTPLRFANVSYGTAADPERQTFQTPSMHRAFNRAAELLRAHTDTPETP